MKRRRRRDPLWWSLFALLGVAIFKAAYSSFKASDHRNDRRRRRSDTKDQGFDAYREEDIDPYQDESMREEKDQED